MDEYTLVERPAPGKAPTAFRIWKAGENATDIGTVVFSERSAELLEQQQAQRGNLFPIDVDHLSISASTPFELRGAIGWHRLEVRRDAEGKAELWAVGVEWSPAARAGLESSPPAWRYFSPVWNRDEETNEVVRYVNTALTNLPATHFVTALAASLSTSLRIPPQRENEALVTEAQLRKQVAQLQREFREFRASTAADPTPAEQHATRAAELAEMDRQMGLAPQAPGVRLAASGTQQIFSPGRSGRAVCQATIEAYSEPAGAAPPTSAAELAQQRARLDQQMGLDRGGVVRTPLYASFSVMGGRR